MRLVDDSINDSLRFRSYITGRWSEVYRYITTSSEHSGNRPVWAKIRLKLFLMRPGEAMWVREVSLIGIILRRSVASVSLFPLQLNIEAPLLVECALKFPQVIRFPPGFVGTTPPVLFLLGSILPLPLRVHSWWKSLCRGGLKSRTPSD